MRFLVDAQLPPALAGRLRDHGFEAQHIFEIGRLDTPDVELRDLAIQQGAILITKDSDFVVAIARSELRVIWVRLGNVSNRVLFAAWDKAWPGIAQQLEASEDLIELH